MTVAPFTDHQSAGQIAPFRGSFGAIAPAAPQPSRSDRMQEWLDLFIKTEHVADVLARTSFVPAGMQGKPAEVAASMMKGFELGMDPLDALANLFVVKGKVGFYAEFMRRRIIEAGHEFLVVEATDSRAVVKGIRHDGDRQSEWQQASFTADQAKKGGIDLGGYPADKLVARATSRLCRRVFPDVLSGSRMVEDIIDGIVVDGYTEMTEAAQPAPPAAAPERAIQRAPRQTRAKASKPAPAAPPPVAEAGIDGFPGMDQPTAADPAAGEPDEPASTAQNRKMHAMFREAQISDRDDRLAVTSKILGYNLDTSAALTMTEANKLIDTLDQWATQGTTDEQVREILNAAALAEAENTTAATTSEEN